MQRRLIDEKETAAFPYFIDKLLLTMNGKANYRPSIEEHGKYANGHFDQMLRDVPTLRDAFFDLNTYTKEERASLRSLDPWPKPLADKIMDVVMKITITNLGGIGVKIPSTVKEASNTFIFRSVFAIYQLLLRRMAEGQLQTFPEAKLRNDMVDMAIVAYATYFEGLLSADKHVNLIFEEVRLRLWAMFDAEIPALTVRA